MTRAAVIAAVIASVLASSAAAAAWHTYRDTAGGYSIAVPASWKVVPRATADVRKLAKKLRAEHQDVLAAQLEEIAATRRTQPAVYRFQALQWPAPKGAAIPDVTVKVDKVAKSAHLWPIAVQLEKALGTPKGATVDPAKTVKLPAGAAARISGTTKLGAKLRSAYVIYLVLRPGRLYTVAFRCLASQQPGDAALFARIAARFKA